VARRPRDRGRRHRDLRREPRHSRGGWPVTQPQPATVGCGARQRVHRHRPPRRESRYRSRHCSGAWYVVGLSPLRRCGHARQNATGEHGRIPVGHLLVWPVTGPRPRRRRTDRGPGPGQPDQTRRDRNGNTAIRAATDAPVQRRARRPTPAGTSKPVRERHKTEPTPKQTPPTGAKTSRLLPLRRQVPAPAEPPPGTAGKRPAGRTPQETNPSGPVRQVPHTVSTTAQRHPHRVRGAVLGRGFHRHVHATPITDRDSRTGKTSASPRINRKPETLANVPWPACPSTNQTRPGGILVCRCRCRRSRLTGCEKALKDVAGWVVAAGAEAESSEPLTEGPLVLRGGRGNGQEIAAFTSSTTFFSTRGLHF
jgi:hypothetical protein